MSRSGRSRPRAPWRVVAAATLLLTVSLGQQPSAQETRADDGWIRHAYVQGPADNPLKGFIPFRGAYTTFPHSMEWDYVAWKDLQSGFDTFTWGPLEAKLDEIAARGHQASFRIYADYPGASSGLPAFLANVPRRPYTDYTNSAGTTSYSPDYDDRNLRRALENIVKALGRRYDGDPRVGFITVGFIGFWGEWHTYRPSCNCDDWMPKPGHLRTVLRTFDKAFKRTPLLVRYPDVGWDGESIGFHDDSFAFETLAPPDWAFAARLEKARATRQWQKHPIGGEVRPEVQPCTFSLVPCNPPGQAFDDSVTATHASWLINQGAFDGAYAGSDYLRALAGARSLGYDLFVAAARIRPVTERSRLTVEVTMQNRGVAPFYYDWPVQIGVADENNELVATFDTKWKLTRVKFDDQDVRLSHSQRGHGLKAGTYRVLLRAVNPLPNGKPLVFANAAWNAHISGWLTLGETTVSLP